MSEHRGPGGEEALPMPDEAPAGTARPGSDRARADAGPAQGAAADEAPSFRQAMEELEGILRRIEGEEIDIDQLAQELRRAAELLDLCRGKIRRAEVEVTQIVQSLEVAGEGDERERP